jgi:cytochrome b subunit of formate dehydrogenase
VQKFSTSETLEVLIQLLGGVERIRVVHRVAAAIFVFEAVYHVLELAWLILVKRSPLTMLPKWKDAQDAIQTLKYFLGLATERAQCDRFDFRHKVEYLSLIWGSIVMIGTGVLMWYPAQASAFLPGEIIPAARVAHGGEGLLACLVIFTWHMYSAHLAPEVFPFDSTIFTGMISEERMIHEHPLEYARIVAAAALDADASAVEEPFQPRLGQQPMSTAPPKELYADIRQSMVVPPLPKVPAFATRVQGQPNLASKPPCLPELPSVPPLKVGPSTTPESFTHDEWYEALRRVAHASNLTAEYPAPPEEEPVELEDIDYLDDAPTGVYGYAPKHG